MNDPDTEPCLWSECVKKHNHGPAYRQLVEAGQPVPRRVTEQLPVTINYLEALKAREKLANIEAFIRGVVNTVPCNDDHIVCKIESLADDAASVERLLREGR